MSQSNLVWNPSGKDFPDRWKWVSRQAAEEAYKLHFKVVDISLNPIETTHAQLAKPEKATKPELLYRPESDDVFLEHDPNEMVKACEAGCVVVTGVDEYEDRWLNEQLGLNRAF